MQYTTYKNYFLMKQEEFKGWLDIRRKHALKFTFKEPDDCFLDSDMLFAQSLGEMEKSKGIFDGYINNQLTSQEKALLIRKFMIEDIQDSNGIEGINTTKKEILDVLDEMKTAKDSKSESYINYYKELWNKGDVSFPTSMKEMRDIWDRLIGNDLSHKEKEKLKPDGMFFRKGQVRITDGMESVDHGFFPEEKIIAGLERSLSILQNNELPHFVRLALFHYFFERVHPFYDGNGRTGRFLLSLFLKANKEEIMAFRISHVLKMEKSSYYKAFKETKDVRNYGDLGTFVIPFLDMVKEQFLSDSEYIKESKSKMERWKRMSSSMKGKGARFVIDEMIVSSAFSDLGLSIDILAERTGLSEITVRRELIKLRKESPSLLDENKGGKRIYFKLK